MAENLFKNRYKTKSIRLKNWDYATPGYYFITICTQNRECVFGVIQDGKMLLSEIGKIAFSSLIETPQYFANAVLDAFVIMPNHVHLLLGITKTVGRDAINLVSTGDGGITGLHNPMLNEGSVSNIIRWYKGRTSFFIRRNPEWTTFAWQPRFYDKIIRDEAELNNVRQYILNNPLRWEFDKCNPS